MELSKISLCRSPTFPAARVPAREACTPPFPAHPCHDSSLPAPTECPRRQRAWTSSRFPTRELQGKRPVSRCMSVIHAPRTRGGRGGCGSLGLQCMILKFHLPPKCCHSGLQAWAWGEDKLIAQYSYPSPEEAFLGVSRRGLLVTGGIWAHGRWE